MWWKDRTEVLVFGSMERNVLILSERQGVLFFPKGLGE